MSSGGSCLLMQGLTEDSLISRVTRQEEPSFDLRFWRSLVSEVLSYSAAEVPEIETSLPVLACLVGFEYDRTVRAREHFHWVEQVHQGTRDLCLGGAYYRPEHAGYNLPEDVRRLAQCLTDVRPETWRAEQLGALSGNQPGFDPDEELEYMQEWFPPLQALYQNARSHGQVVVCEQL